MKTMKALKDYAIKIEINRNKPIYNGFDNWSYSLCVSNGYEEVGGAMSYTMVMKALRPEAIKKRIAQYDAEKAKNPPPPPVDPEEEQAVALLKKLGFTIIKKKGV